MDTSDGFRDIRSEEPHIHWEYVSVENKIVLDLGCGDFGNLSVLSYPSTLEYFLQLGCKYVIGVDLSEYDVNKLKSIEYAHGDSFKLLCEEITSPDRISELIQHYKVDVVKSDIEGGEVHLFNVPDKIFSTVEEYYIETHGSNLYDMAIEKLNRCGYVIYEKINLVHAQPSKVIFARKK
jgi:SAM-dependent methyltransferase